MKIQASIIMIIALILVGAFSFRAGYIDGYYIRDKQVNMGIGAWKNVEVTWNESVMKVETREYPNPILEVYGVEKEGYLCFDYKIYSDGQTLGVKDIFMTVGGEN